jgi:hypothetical protein
MLIVEMVSAMRCQDATTWARSRGGFARSLQKISEAQMSVSAPVIFTEG